MSEASMYLLASSQTLEAIRNYEGLGGWVRAGSQPLNAIKVRAIANEDQATHISPIPLVYMSSFNATAVVPVAESPSTSSHFHTARHATLQPSPFFSIPTSDPHGSGAHPSSKDFFHKELKITRHLSVNISILIFGCIGTAIVATLVIALLHRRFKREAALHTIIRQQQTNNLQTDAAIAHKRVKLNGMYSPTSFDSDCEQRYSASIPPNYFQGIPLSRAAPHEAPGSDIVSEVIANLQDRTTYAPPQQSAPFKPVFVVPSHIHRTALNGIYMDGPYPSLTRLNIGIQRPSPHNKETNHGGPNSSLTHLNAATQQATCPKEAQIDVCQPSSVATAPDVSTKAQDPGSASNPPPGLGGATHSIVPVPRALVPRRPRPSPIAHLNFDFPIRPPKSYDGLSAKSRRRVDRQLLYIPQPPLAAVHEATGCQTNSTVAPNRSSDLADPEDSERRESLALQLGRNGFKGHRDSRVPGRIPFGVHRDAEESRPSGIFRPDSDSKSPSASFGTQRGAASVDDKDGSCLLAYDKESTDAPLAHLDEEVGKQKPWVEEQAWVA